MKSMTGYGEASQTSAGIKISVQVKTLNHRHLDLQLKVPREYLSLEEEIRKTVRETLARGRVEVFVHRLAERGRTRKVELDEELLGQYLRAIRGAQKKYQLTGDVGVSLFASLPDLFRVAEIEGDVALEKRALFAALRGALDKLELARKREGRRLRDDMQAQIRQLRRIAGALEQRAAEINARLQGSGAAGDEQPAGRRDKNGGDGAGGILKGDINEETVRMKSHVVALGQAIREREPVGKKIDFMLQETQRELNTISSKLPQLEIVKLVLEGKERVEKIREQTQNIE